MDYSPLVANTERVVLERARFADQIQVEVTMLDDHAFFESMVKHRLVRFQAAVVSESAVTQSREITWTTYHRPRWLPRWLWVRVPTSIGRARMTVDTRHIRPTADLEQWFGPAVRKCEVHLTTTETTP